MKKIGVADIPVLMGIRVEVGVDHKIKILLTPGLDPTTPDHLQEIIVMMAQGMQLLVDNYLVKLKGENQPVLSDAVKIAVQNIIALVQKYMPTLEGQIIASPSAAVVHNFRNP